VSPVAIGLVLLVCVAVVVTAIMVPAYFRQRIDWRPLRGSSYKYASLEPISEALLERAVNEAFVTLRSHADFVPATIAAAATNLRIVVQRVNEWESPAHGSKVAGVTMGTDVYVGKDLKALCHEVAHVCEFMEGGPAAVDGTHASWGRRGIYRAVNVYENWLEATVKTLKSV
jgi:hypothetical protein